MSANQGDLFAQEGMDRAEAHADPDWLLAARRIVWQLCKEGQAFTTDSVWYRLEALGVSTGEPRALGAVMKAAASAGFITATGSYFKSSRPECHSRPLALWLPTAKVAEVAA